MNSIQVQTLASKVGAVVVTLDPPPDFVEALKRLLAVIPHIVIVDNASSDTTWMPAAENLARTQLIRNTSNRGIATALNQGLRTLQSSGQTRGLLLDHDSRLSADNLLRLCTALDAAPGDALGAVPCLHHPHPNMRCRWPQALSRWRFRFVYADEIQQLTPVDVAISSGMLLDLNRMDAIGWFRDKLFIDLVDTELCLRARRHSFRLYAAPGAWMTHSIGTPVERKSAGVRMYPTFHSALRHYYLARNRIHLYRDYAVAFPFWAIYETLGGLKLLAKVLLFEPGRLHKLRSMLRGTWDGLRGRLGPAPFANLSG